MSTCCRGTCHSGVLCTQPSSVLFCSISCATPPPPHTHTHTHTHTTHTHTHTHTHAPSSSTAWVMACVDFLSLWEVVLHGSPLSSCFHACPFNRLGNPSWYLYRPWFSWYRCSPSSSSSPSSPSAAPLRSLSSLVSFAPPPPHLHFVSPFLITCSSSQVSIHSDPSSRFRPTPIGGNCQNTSELISLTAEE